MPNLDYCPTSCISCAARDGVYMYNNQPEDDPLPPALRKLDPEMQDVLKVGFNYFHILLRILDLDQTWTKESTYIVKALRQAMKWVQAHLLIDTTQLLLLGDLYCKL